jgi:hypothetical protein
LLGALAGVFLLLDENEIKIKRGEGMKAGKAAIGSTLQVNTKSILLGF